MIKKIAFLILFGVMYELAFAQLTSPEKGDNPYIPTWETYEFMKYGVVGASLYTGTVNYSVPIYTYEDDDFKYSITVDYATNGFRVNHKSGPLGHGWSLNSPGIITREIRGLADDGYKDITTLIAASKGIVELKGYNLLPKENLIATTLFNFSNNKVYPAMLWVDGNKQNYYDAQPDIYRFNFCGYSGSFRVIPPLSDKSSFLFFDCTSKSQSLKIEKFGYDSIIMTDGDGYKYTFIVGEFTREAFTDEADIQLKNVVRQWKLKKITAPNGKMLEFFYSSFPVNLEILDKSNNDISYTTYFDYDFMYINDYFLGNTQNMEKEIFTNNVFSSRLERIKLPDGTQATIRYEDGIAELRYTKINGQTSEAFGCNKRIKSIDLHSPDNSLIKRALFDYNIVEGKTHAKNRITFLKSIDVSGQGTFTFEYNPMLECPPLGTINSDHWGYYNGSNGGFATDDIFSNLVFDDNYNESYSPLFNRKPDFRASLSGTLCKITYPTGGYSTISYEQHDCSNKVIRTSNTGFIPELSPITTNEPVGGVRLKQVITYSSKEIPVDTVNYEYKSKEGISTGILLGTPRYGIDYIAKVSMANANDPVRIKSVMRLNLLNSIYDYSHTHIEYSHVRERKSSEGSTDYYFKTYKDCPDRYTDETDKDLNYCVPVMTIFSYGGGPGTMAFYNPSPLVSNLLTPVASAQTKRGLISSIEKYDQKGALVVKASYEYNYPLVNTDIILTVTGEETRGVFYPRYNIELVSKEETVAYGNTSVSSKKMSKFNKFGAEVWSEYIASDGKHMVDEYHYSGDSKTKEGVIGQMQKANNVNSLLLHERKAVADGKEFVVRKTRYNYYMPNTEKTSLFKVKNVETWTPEKGWMQKESFLHNDYGRIKQQTDSNGVATSYLWGYKGRYPLMVAKNASRSTLEKVLSSKGIDIKTLGIANNYSQNTFESLIVSANKLPASMVEVYKFKPNFGMTEYVMPNSLRTYYNYDGYARLVSIADSKRHIVEDKDYNLVSILPLSASILSYDIYANDTANYKVSASGGSKSYKYSFKILDKQENPVYELQNNTGEIEFNPLNIGISSNARYFIQCEVEDEITGDIKSLRESIMVKPAKLFFSEIKDFKSHPESGDLRHTAKIYTDKPTDVTFGLDLVSTKTCTISVTGKTKEFIREKDAEFVAHLEAGNNDISISFPASVEIIDASLWIKSATGGHEIGEPNLLYITY